ncbi:MAG: N-acetylglucosaminyl-diphospho-decaprenol L-rhamnosyltransferase [Chlamydiales bacterium]|jgi:N-acetylglucosaminyl-diphospho-decaprenol L-rhamnosyltransferase
MKAGALDLSILIVSYNTRELTLACLASVFDLFSGPSFEVVLVDNASSDGSAEAIRERFPQVVMLTPGSNLGFGRANNLAAKQARGERLLLLNPDTEIQAGSLEAMYAWSLKAEHDVLLGGRTFYADGRLEPRSCCGNISLWSLFCMATGLARLAPGSRLLDPESMGRWKRDSVRDVDIIAGCLLMITKTFWDQLGGFDEDFFMYGEDYDLCMRAWDAGGRCTHLPEAKIIHHVGASELVRADRMIKIFSSRTQLFRKHWGAGHAWLGTRIFDAWALGRMITFRIAGLLSGRFRASSETWTDIWAGRKGWHRC